MSLKLCSIGARGLWMEMLSIMGISERRGYLQIGGVPITLSQLAKLANVSEEETKVLFDELKNQNVFSVSEDGIPFNRRMVKETTKYEESVLYGKMGGSPLLKRSQNPEARIQKLEATDGLTTPLNGGVKGQQALKGNDIQDGQGRIETDPPSVDAAPPPSSPAAAQRGETAGGRRFVPPTPKEVEEYAKTIDFEIDGAYFVAYYEAAGWMRGKTPIKNWKMAVVTWKKNGSQYGRKTGGRSGKSLQSRCFPEPEGKRALTLKL